MAGPAKRSPLPKPNARGYCRVPIPHGVHGSPPSPYSWPTAGVGSLRLHCKGPRYASFSCAE
eukprot:4137252-Alexandrium_andersonii.AAC.1